MTWITPYHQAEDFTWPLTLEDRITIFSEQTLGWQLDIADACINGGLPSMRHAGWAVLMIAFSYFEMIAKFKDGCTGKETRSAHFFRAGVEDAFPDIALFPPQEKEEALTILYRSARCGFYHSGMAQGRITISSEYEQSLAYSSQVKYVFINPHRLIPDLRAHFLRYMEALTDPQNTDLRDRFARRFDHLQNWDPLSARLS
jgi:hypothetical protein